MNRRTFLALAGAVPAMLLPWRKRRTQVSIHGDMFYVNGKPSYAGRHYKGMKIEGLLMNARVVQGIFDDLNPETRATWAYPDTGKWDPERNTNEFVAAMPEWRRSGLMAFTVNLQGGTPRLGGAGGRRGAPVTAPAGQANGRGSQGGIPPAPQLENTAIGPDGDLRPAYMARLARILDRADELGMVAIVGYFYFGQNRRVKDEAAVRRAVTNVTNWLLDKGYGNVLVEIANECNIGNYHDVLKPPRIDEMIELVKSLHRGGRRLLVGTSYGGDTPATNNVVKASDFLLLHGNGPDDPAIIRKMIQDSRSLEAYRPMPVLINEDPHFRFGEPNNLLMTAIGDYASWGYYDQGQGDYVNGYQSPPVNWSINTDLKKQFFAAIRDITIS